MSTVRSDYVRPVDFKRGRVDMSHGGGGRAMAQLIDELFLRAFDNDWLRQGNDGALLPAHAGRIVRSFHTMNTRPARPVRAWRKSTGDPIVTATSAAATTRIGAVTTSRTAAPVTSIARFTRSYTVGFLH